MGINGAAMALVNERRPRCLFPECRLLMSRGAGGEQDVASIDQPALEMVSAPSCNSKQCWSRGGGNQSGTTSTCVVAVYPPGQPGPLVSW
jgi:hypothetical protein